MPLSLGLTDDEVLAIAQPILGEQLASHHFDHAEVRSGPDYDDEDALFIAAVLKPSGGMVPAETIATARTAVNDALRANGERRFAYFKLDRPDEPSDESEQPL